MDHFSYLPLFPAGLGHKFVNRRWVGNMMRQMSRIATALIMIVLVGSFAHAQREFRSATRFDPPPESFHAPDSLRVLEDQLKRGRFIEAATQIESLLRDN